MTCTSLYLLSFRRFWCFDRFLECCTYLISIKLTSLLLFEKIKTLPHWLLLPWKWKIKIKYFSSFYVQYLISSFNYINLTLVRSIAHYRNRITYSINVKQGIISLRTFKLFLCAVFLFSVGARELGILVFFSFWMSFFSFRFFHSIKAYEI